MSLHSFIENAKVLGIRPTSRKKITATRMYPWASEREMQNGLLDEFIKAGQFYSDSVLKNTVSLRDDINDLTSAEFDGDEAFKSIASKAEYSVETFAQNTFENFTDTVIGARYIPPVVSPTINETWEQNFMTLCRSTTDEMKKKISSIVSDAVMNGNNIADTRKQIEETVASFSRTKANLIARTETAKLNTAINKAQMEEAGVEYYEWACMMDERSRDSHEKMDGKICPWSNPNKVYNKDTGKLEDRPNSAVHLHPGEDFNCRCVALPWDPLIEEDINQKKGKPNKGWIEMKEKERQREEEKAAKKAEAEKAVENAEKAKEVAAKAEELAEKAREEKEKAEKRAEIAEKKAEEEKLISENKENENKYLKSVLESPFLIEKKKKGFLKKSQEKSTNEAKKILEERKKTNSSLSTDLLSPVEYEERGKYTLADEATIKLAKKNSKERNKFIEELKMAKLVEDKLYLSTVFIGETSVDGSNPDALIDGILAEYKHTEPNTGKNAVSGNLKKAIEQGAKTVFLDIQSDVNYGDAWNAINGRLKGKSGITVYFKLKGSDNIHIFKKK